MSKDPKALKGLDQLATELALEMPPLPEHAFEVADPDWRKIRNAATFNAHRVGDVYVKIREIQKTLKMIDPNV